MIQVSILCLFLWLNLAPANSAVVLSILDVATSSELANVSLRMYPSQNITDYTAEKIENVSLLSDLFDANKRTVLYISGWSETPESKSVQTILDAYFQRNDHNVVVVDWQDIAAKNYIAAALSTYGVGTAVAEALNVLVAAGVLNSSSIHIVGHSLGGQVASAIGRQTNFTVDRISGLDPAGPAYELAIQHLSATDAAFVDVIHTDAGVYGSLSSSGIVQFWPNGGVRFQRGCPVLVVPGSSDDFCSHHRSWYYWAESLLNETAFIGLNCNSWALFALGLCKSNTAVVMGYATPTTASGQVYLQTNKVSPYGRGATGQTYEV